MSWPRPAQWRAWSLPVTLSLLDQALVSGAHFALNVLLARWVAPSEYGIFAISFSLFLLLSGLHVALILEPMNVLGAARPAAELGAYVGSLVRAHALLTVSLSVVVAVVGLALRARNASLAASFLALAAALPFLLLQWLLRQACYLRTRPDLAVRGSVVYVATLAVCLVAVRTVAVAPVTAAFPAMALASLAAAAVLWRPLGVSLPAGLTPPQHLLAANWSYGRWIIAASLAHNTGNALYLPLVAALLGLAAGGTLKAVQNLALPLQQLLTALSLPAFPWLSRQAALHGPAHSRRASLGLVSAYVVVATAYGAVIAGLGGSLLRLLYGSGPYAELGWAVLLVAAAGVVAGAAQALGLALRAMGRPQAILWSKLAAALLLLAAGTVLVRRNGLYGALVGVVLGHLGETAVLAALLRSKR